MKRVLRISALLFSIGTVGLTSCKKEADTSNGTEGVALGGTAGVASSGLIGTWKLTSPECFYLSSPTPTSFWRTMINNIKECFCLPSPTPNETVVFTASGFAFYTDSRLKANGTYSFGTATRCGSSPVSCLTLVYTGTNTAPRRVTYTLAGNQLILDQGAACDAPRDTYVRLP